jgi:hypothetical protein
MSSVLIQMQTRSQALEGIDFDASSKAWRRNKLRIGGGAFRYKCEWHEGCKKKVFGRETLCRWHYLLDLKTRHS